MKTLLLAEPIKDILETPQLIGQVFEFLSSIGIPVHIFCGSDVVFSFTFGSCIIVDEKFRIDLQIVQITRIYFLPMAIIYFGTRRREQFSFLCIDLLRRGFSSAEKLRRLLGEGIWSSSGNFFSFCFSRCSQTFCKTGLKNYFYLNIYQRKKVKLN